MAIYGSKPGAVAMRTASDGGEVRRGGARVAAPRRMTYEEFMRLPEERTRCELISGWVVREPAPGYRHQSAVGNLYGLLWNHLRRGGRGKVLLGPFDAVLSRENVVQPDISYVSPERSHLVTARHLQGAPDLAIEVLSPHSARKDRVWRLAQYARAGVREYWIVDPQQQTVEVFVLEDPPDEGREPRYESAGVFRPGTPVRSRVLPDFTFDPGDVFRL